MLNIEKFEEFISQFPIYEYRIIDTKPLKAEERVRIVCEKECSRYNTTWACPPAVGCLEECERKIHEYPKAVFFSSVAEVNDIMDMEELLRTRNVHEELTTEIGNYLKGEGHEIFILSTESCDLCESCTYPEGKPCRFPEKMHPCLESYGIVAAQIVEEEQMEYQLGGSTVLWFSMVLFS